MGDRCKRSRFRATVQLYGPGAQKPWFLSKIRPDWLPLDPVVVLQKSNSKNAGRCPTGSQTLAIRILFRRRLNLAAHAGRQAGVKRVKVTGHISVPHPKLDLGVGLVHKLLKQAGLK
jgi:predicted RNA binding protein YcfA (HicA-like mRNA interferase family)